MGASEKSHLLRRRILVSGAACVCVFLIVLSGIVYTLGVLISDLHDGNAGQVARGMLFLFVAMLLSYGTLTYLLARKGQLKRLLSYRPASLEGPSNFLSDIEPPSVTVLIPSYSEEVHVVRKTMLSAILQEYPRRRVVLLIDDPLHPEVLSETQRLQASRGLPDELQKLLVEPGRECASAMERFLNRMSSNNLDPTFESRQLSELCRYVAVWYEDQAEAHKYTDYTDQFFVELVFEEPARRLRKKAEQWECPAETGLLCSEKALSGEYNRLLSLFSVDISSFERKRYLNLSHKPNKASNINSYIGLIGKSHSEIHTDEGAVLRTTGSGNADFTVPETEFILTLDADTLISPDYTSRMVNCMGQPENGNLAIAQSPYTAFPHPPRLLQRIAGAQTDIQYLVHQGLTYYDATYWVGANALVRISALREIATVSEDRGFEIVNFIQDSTQIEDTESSIDLINNCWRLFNYPKRLAFSATPPDFGALLIQRGRWANGGLLILPKLMRYCRNKGANRNVLMETFMRAQYLISLGPVSVALLIILLFSFELNIGTYWIFVTAIVYFSFYMRDLYLNGYGWSDLFRVYALNLLLVPVNVGGMGRSVYQGCTGRKAPFRRTPKTENRTPVPSMYIIAEYVGLLALVLLSYYDFRDGYPIHGAFLLIHAMFLLYAIRTFLGFRNSVKDIAPSWLR